MNRQKTWEHNVSAGDSGLAKEQNVNAQKKENLTEHSM